MKTPNELVRASAGTGKTERLASQVLARLRDGAPPESILAVTFTRKAAGEIFERILRRLTELKDPGDLRALAAVTANLDRIGVSTLDSLLFRMASVLRMDLGLPSGFAVTDAEDPAATRIREAALAALLAAHPAETMAMWMGRLRSNGTGKSVVGVLEEIARELHGVYREAPAAAWERFPEEAPGARERLRTAAEALRAAVAAAKDKRIQKTLEKIAAAARAEDVEGTLGVDFFAKFAAGNRTYYKKPVDESVVRALESLASAAVERLTADLGRRARISRALLETYDRAYENACRAHRSYRFDDLSLRLAAETFGGDAANRLGPRILHLLLDEFQDTSRAQWRILEPLARACAEGTEGSLFIVGDPKQAIYGWRGGCAALFAAVVRTFGFDAAHQPTLVDSFRSAPEILATVDSVFSSLVGNPYLGESAAAVAQWSAGYQPHRSARPERPGHAILLEVDATAEEAPREAEEEEPEAGESSEPPAILALAARYAARIHRARPAARIAILVARNRTIPPLLRLLEAERIRASGEGGRPLADEPAVAVLLSALRLALHPDDSRAAFHVANSPLGPRDPAAIRRDLIDRGLARLLDDWTRLLAPSCDPHGLERLERLIERADRHERSRDPSPASFLRWIEASNEEDPSASAVRVMTIHRAKGLEFDAVILPELERGIGRVGRALVHLRRDEETGRIREIVPALAENLRAHDATLRAACEEERIRRIEDDLSALYVAMTRPRNALILLVSSQFAGASPTPAKVLRSALASGVTPRATEDAGARVLYETGDPDWTSRWIGPEANPPAASIAPVRIELPVSDRRARRDAEVLRGEEILAGDGAERIRGRILHLGFEAIEWWNPTRPLDEAKFRERARAAEPGAAPEEIEEALEAFRGALARPAVRRALAYPEDLAAGETAEVWRERSFVATRPEGDRMDGRWDRVVVVRRAGRPVRAALWDFKSGNARTVERYRGQIESYLAALERILGLPRASIEARLLFFESGETV